MKSLLFASALGLATPCLAFAQTTVDSVIVTGQRDPEDPPVVADARARLSETPGAVSVISQESFENREALALDDMLRDAPGVYAQRKFGGDIRISIRGSGIGNANHNRGLLIAQDGMPLNEADGYGDSQIADPLLTRYVEVYRGGNALRFGGALLGGAINMVTPNGQTAGFDQQVRIDGGSFGLLRENVQVARQFGDWDVYGAATNQRSDGERPQSAQNIQYYSFNAGRAFGEGREIRVIINAADISQGIAGALTSAQFKADPRQAAPANVANAYGRDVQALRGALQTHWRFDDHMTFDGAVYAVWKELYHPIFQIINQESRNYGAFGRVNWDGQVAGLRADAYAGAWLRTGDMDSPFYVNNHAVRGALSALSYQDADAADVFAEGRLFVTDRFALVGGLTAGEAKRHYQSFKITGFSSTFDLLEERSYDWVAPRIGVLWEGDDGAQVFANITKSVEPPNFGSLSPNGSGFAPVRPQAAWTMEAGARGRSGPFTYDLTLYRAKLDGEMLQYTVDADKLATTFNADKTIHQGLEAALDWRFMPGWRLRQTYTWSDFRFDGDAQYGDNRLPIAPQSFYRAELRYEGERGWFIAPSIEYSSSAWVDYKNTTQSPDYGIVNLNMGWNISAKVSVFLDARNLTDEVYVSNVQAAISALPTLTAPGGPAAYWPGDGRAVYAGFTAAF